MVATGSRRSGQRDLQVGSAAGALKPCATPKSSGRNCSPRSRRDRSFPSSGRSCSRFVVEGRETPLYQVLAERLLAKYGLVARHRRAGRRPRSGCHHGLAAPVSRAQRRRVRAWPSAAVACRTSTARSTICSRRWWRPPPESSLQPLRDLASVSGFKLFVTTTPDDLLARAIDAERHAGIAKTDHIVFAPKLASGTLRRSARDALLRLHRRLLSVRQGLAFAVRLRHSRRGHAGVHPQPADQCRRGHEAAVLGVAPAEPAAHRLQLRRLAEPVLHPRFQRAATRRQPRQARIPDRSSQSDNTGSLTLFLERFSPDTWVFPGSAREFVAELARRWQERHPRSAPRSDDTTEAVPAPRTDDTLFVSYSRTDLAAARRLFTGLQDIGADVAWFDKSELKPGDDWEQKIRNAINGCYLFLPLVSANTETREEGFFREEWTLAGERSSPHPGPQVHHPGRRGSRLRRQCRPLRTGARELSTRPFRPRPRRRSERRSTNRADAADPRAAQPSTRMSTEPLVAGTAIDAQNPWPGLSAFDEPAQRFFNGRDAESAELLRLVGQASLTVLFGKSGLGKTSPRAGRAVPTAAAAEHPARLCPARRA